jgi:hypothetical protein
MTKRILNLALIPLLLLTFTLSSCSKDDDDDYGKNYSALFSKTDYFIDMLDKVYERYDAFGSKAADTSDGKYTVTPMGRLIIVKKKTYNTDVTYEEVKSALENHYKNTYKVKDVFLNNGGTVTIDCRK